MSISDTAQPRPHRVAFDLTMPLPTGRTVLEASAGTGKTYSLTALIVRYIAERNIAVDQLLVVTFTRAAANELRDRTRSVLRLAAHALSAGTDPHDCPPWMSTFAGADISEQERDVRRRRVLDALSRFDEITITTIHGFCQQALAQLGLRAGGNPNAVLVENTRDIIAEVCRDVLITELADDPARLSPSGSTLRTPAEVETDLIAGVKAVLSNPGAELVPDDSTVMVTDVATQAMARQWSQLVRNTCAAVQQRQNDRGEIGYDKIISGLHDALIDPDRGSVVAEQLAQRYSVVLVDEFQDTDRVQWQVFKRAFASRVLVTVGDPKQAIYRFRGADVHAYLNAADEPIVYSLAINHRSDRQLLAGLEHLLNGATLGDPRIAFIPVQASERAPFNALTHGASVHIRAVSPHAHLMNAKGNDLSMPKVRQLVLTDLVARTIDLLDNASINMNTGDEPSPNDVHPVHPVHPTRPVRPGDIAVLVPSHTEAENVAVALRRSGVPAVRTRTGSVLATPSVMQWRLLLTALARPADTPSVRGGALGWFLSTDPLDLCGDDADDVLANLQERVALMAARMRRVGFAAFYDEEKARPGLLQTLLTIDDGERHLTDLDHIAELLTAALPANCEPSQVLRTLDDMVAADDDRSEATMRRIDSDALAVQITTIHSAKGLEYPIVLLPFGFKGARAAEKPYSYTSRNGLRTIDIASVVPWDEGLGDPADGTSRRDQKARHRHAKTDCEGDDLRLLYVALTRAQHRLEVWWASTQHATTSALARVLLDRNGAGPIENSRVHLHLGPKGGWNETKPAYTQMSPDDIIDQLRTIAESSDGAIALTELAEHLPTELWSGNTAAPTLPLRAASVGQRGSLHDPAWRRWSFTRLSGEIDARTNDAIMSGASQFHPTRGGSDEPTDAADGVVGAPLTSVTVSPPPTPTGVIGHLANVAAGTTFGTFVHAVLEDLDFTSNHLEADLVRLLQHQAARTGLQVDVNQIALGLAAALRTPLGPLFNGLTLAHISPHDRLAELTFDMAIASATSAKSATSATSATSAASVTSAASATSAASVTSATSVESVTHAYMPARDIANVLLRTLSNDDVIRPFAQQLATEATDIDVGGWMNGSIDALVRIPHRNAHRYLVIDYKTNRLHVPGAADPVAAYAPNLLVAAMEHHRYPLQALLYSVAVHRYLRWRLGDIYDPDQHLGGVGYLFVRGMVGPNTPLADGVPHGVFSWRPPTASIVALDELFATGSDQ